MAVEVARHRDDAAPARGAGEIFVYPERVVIVVGICDVPQTVAANLVIVLLEGRYTAFPEREIVADIDRDGWIDQQLHPCDTRVGLALPEAKRFAHAALAQD